MYIRVREEGLADKGSEDNLQPQRAKRRRGRQDTSKSVTAKANTEETPAIRPPEAKKGRQETSKSATTKANTEAVSYPHLRAHETVLDLVCRSILEKKTQRPT